MSRIIKTEHKQPLSLNFYTPIYTPLRRAKIIVMYNVMSKHKAFRDFSKQRQEYLIMSIENPIWLYALEKNKEESIVLDDVYSTICYRIMSNLDPELVYNENLCNKVLNFNIDFNHLARMSSQELFPEMYVEIIDHMNKIKAVESIIKTSALYQCRRCKENKCTIENIITRSIDEGVSVKVTCINCGMSWVIR